MVYQVGRIKRRLASAALAVGIVGGGMVAMAGQADASTLSQCFYPYNHPGYEECYVTYNWWEWMEGYRNGWQLFYIGGGGTVWGIN